MGGHILARPVTNQNNFESDLQKRILMKKFKKGIQNFFGQIVLRQETAQIYTVVSATFDLVMIWH